MLHGIHHTAISTANLERSLAFYRDLLGFTVMLEAGWEKGFDAGDRVTGLKDSATRVAMLSAGNAMIELFEYESPTPSPADPNRPVHDHGITHICLVVSDLDAEYERLKDAGMRFHCPPQEFRPNVVLTYGRDPDGNVIELLEDRRPNSPIALNLK